MPRVKPLIPVLNLTGGQVFSCAASNKRHVSMPPLRNLYWFLTILVQGYLTNHLFLVFSFIPLFQHIWFALLVNSSYFLISCSTGLLNKIRKKKENPFHLPTCQRIATVIHPSSFLTIWISLYTNNILSLHTV